MGNPKFSNAAVEISLKLAMIYAMQKRYEEADQGYNFCIHTMHAIINKRPEINEDPNDDNNVERKESTKDGKSKDDNKERTIYSEVDKDTMALLGMCYNSYSRFLYVMKQYDAADLMLRASLKIASQSLGLDHPQVVTIHNDLAAIATLRGRLDEALEQSTRAVELAKKNSPEDLPQMVLNLGNVYARRKDYDDAKKYCGDALKMAKQIKNAHLQKAAQCCLDDMTGESK